MTAGGRAQAVLRVGIAKSGTLAMERRLPLDRSVTIGGSRTDSIVVAGLSESRTVFVKGPHGLSLAPEVRRRAKVRRGDPEATLTLGDRGRIDLGEVTVLYQLVLAPPMAARAPLSAADFRPRWIEDDDPVFLQSLATWSALGLLLGIYVATAPAPQNTGIDLLADRLATLPTPVYVDLPPPTPEPEVERPTVANVTKPERQIDRVAEPEVAPRTAERRATDIAAARRGIEERLQRSGLIATSGDTSWAIDAQDAVAIDSLEARSHWDGDDDAPRVAQAGLPMGAGRDIEIEEVGGGEAGLRNIPIVSQPPTFGTGDEEPSDPVVVGRELKRYASQIRYCFEKELKRDPSLSGRVELGGRLESGRFVSVWTEDETVGSAALEACMHERVRAWALPKGSSGSVYWAYVFSAKE